MSDTALGGGSVGHTIDKDKRKEKELQLIEEKRKQPGIGFPSASIQKHLLIIRLNLAPPPPPSKLKPAEAFVEVVKAVKGGLLRLCTLLAKYENGTKRIDVLGELGNQQMLPLSEFHFSATIGFGIGFFELLKIPEAKRPKKLRAMPDHQGLGDIMPYSLGQTDMIIQLGSSEDFVNHWVLENVLHPIVPPKPGEAPPAPEDIISAVAGWATITDVHAGFQRLDARNLQGFNDGVSNPRRLSSLFDELVWTTERDEGSELTDGTYMVFQKIIHDLDQWRALDVEKQQLWVGRSKGTGLLLGTFSEEKDAQLAKDLRSLDDTIYQQALLEWEPKFKEQADPQTRLYDHVDGDLNGKPSYHQVPNQCPAWSHVRKANPRQEDGKFPEHLIFRRGYPFMEKGIDHKIRSGLLFVSFQKDIADSFEFIKKNWFGNRSFPAPGRRPFTTLENEARHRRGRFSEQELRTLTTSQRKVLSLSDDDALRKAISETQQPATQETGREGLAGPSENGMNPTGEFLAIVPLGGGYYFCPPIPKKDPAQIGQQFFDVSTEQPDTKMSEASANEAERLSSDSSRPFVLVASVGDTERLSAAIDSKDEEARVAASEPRKITELGSYLIIARYNREKWNRLNSDEQIIARKAATRLFPFEPVEEIKALPNNMAKEVIDKFSDEDPRKGVHLVHTFHTRDFVQLDEIVNPASLRKVNLETLGEAEREQREKELVNDIFSAPKTNQKDPGIGWIAVIDGKYLSDFVAEMGGREGPLWRMYDMEVIALNNDQTTADIYIFMTPVSWRK